MRVMQCGAIVHDTSNATGVRLYTMRVMQRGAIVYDTSNATGVRLCYRLIISGLGSIGTGIAVRADNDGILMAGRALPSAARVLLDGVWSIQARPARLRLGLRDPSHIPAGLDVAALAARPLPLAR
jgi:hypothetical protein